MVKKRIESELRIRAVDEVSAKLRTMQSASGRFVSGMRADAARLQAMRGPIKLVEDFGRLKDKSAASGAALEGAREKLRALEAQFKSAANPTRAMYAAIEKGRREVERASDAHQKNRAALASSGASLRAAGVNVRDLANEERRLRAEFDAGTAALGRQIPKVERLAALHAQMAESRKRMDESLGRAANLTVSGYGAIYGGQKIMRGLRAPVAEAIEFESAMADVKKVVDFETPAAFKEMGDDVLDLSGEISMLANDIAGIVASGGQAGIAQEDLLRFAERAAKAGVAFDVAADAAGDGMAKTKTAMGLSLDQTSALFDAMNHLSNNSAAKAAQTLDFLTRAGADGQNFGFDATETLAIGAAMIAAGAEADTAATSFRNAGRALTRGTSATDRQAGAFKSLGLNAEEVAKAMQSDAVGTLADVFDRLRDLPKHRLAPVMSDLFGDEARDLAKLVGNAELMPQMLRLIAEEKKYLGSVDKEYEARAATSANNLIITRNHMTKLGVTIGTILLPPLNDFLELVNGAADSLSNMAEKYPKLTKAALYGSVAVAGLAVAGGVVMSASAGVLALLATLRFGLSAFSLRAAFAAGELLGLGGALSRLGRVPALALSSLVKPLKWSAALLPDFAPALARFAGFRKSASAEMSGLSRDVAREAGAMSRELSRLKVGAASAGIMTALAVSRLPEMEDLPEDPEARAAAIARAEEARARNAAEAEAALRDVPGLGWLMGKYDAARDWVHGAPEAPADPAPASGPVAGDPAPVASAPGDAGSAPLVRPVARPAPVVRPVARPWDPAPVLDPVPAPVAPGSDLVAPGAVEARLAALRADLAAYEAEAEAVRAALAEIPSGGLVPDPRSALLADDLSAAEHAAEGARARLKEAEEGAAALSAALDLVAAVSVAPVVDDASIEAARRKVESLARALGALGAGAEVSAPNPGAGSVPRPVSGVAQKLAGARARGGGVVAGLPYRVNEDTPRSEIMVPSASGAVLTVQQGQRALVEALLPRGGRKRSADLPRPGLGALSPAVRGLQAASLAAVSVASSAGSGAPGPVNISIGGVSVSVPAPVTDPAAIADYVAEAISREVAQAVNSTFRG